MVLGSPDLGSSEVGFAELQQLALNSRIQGLGSSIRERPAGGEDYGRGSSPPIQVQCEIQVEPPHT